MRIAECVSVRTRAGLMGLTLLLGASACAGDKDPNPGEVDAGAKPDAASDEQRAVLDDSRAGDTSDEADEPQTDDPGPTPDNSDDAPIPGDDEGPATILPEAGADSPDRTREAGSRDGSVGGGSASTEAGADDQADSVDDEQPNEPEAGAVDSLADAGTDAGSSNATELFIVADDGSATLTIPPGALPPGVRERELRIVRDDTIVTDYVGGTARAWAMYPHGIVFAEPVQLRLNVDLDPTMFWSVLHWSDDSFEFLKVDDAQSSFDDAQGRYSELAVSVEHFSTTVVLYRDGDRLSGPLSASLDWAQPAADVVQGQTTSVVLRAFAPNEVSESVTMILGDEEAEITGSVSLSDWTSEVTWSVTPQLVPEAGAGAEPREVVSRDVVSADHEAFWICEQTGDYTISAEVNLDVPWRAYARTRPIPTLGDPEPLWSEPLTIPGYYAGRDSIATGATCRAPHQCDDVTSACTDEGDDCPLSSSSTTPKVVPQGVVSGSCAGYEYADIVSFVGACGSGFTLTTQMAAPIPSGAGSFSGRYQTTLHLRTADGYTFQLIGISDDGEAFNVFGSGPGDATGSTVSVDAMGRLVQQVSQTTLQSLGAPVTGVVVDTYLSLDATNSERWDDSREFPFPCP